MLGMELPERALDKPRVQLNLVDSGYGARLVDQAPEMGLGEVGDADAPGSAVVVDLLECPPRLHVEVFAGAGQWMR